VDVRAAAMPDARVEPGVADTGAGLDGGTCGGHGEGLANIRERLELLYGDVATLDLRANEPTGFVARILLPARHANDTTS
jgi:LytS/YehU family sensor histidine kinase